MTSQFGAQFNHDPWAAAYDADVREEANPIRAGYAETLAWTVDRARIGPNSTVLDLGCGTGNTSALIREAAQIVCVDLSENMMQIGRDKLAHLRNVTFVRDDLLAYCAADGPAFDAVISTYAVHHLTDDEKAQLFASVANRLSPGGRAVFGDLMFANAAARAQVRAQYAALSESPSAGAADVIAEVIEAIDEEFFWLVDRAVADLAATGLVVEEYRQFSELSWGICARKPERD
jgi:putative AdoMet-dependent methyltransferase